MTHQNGDIRIDILAQVNDLRVVVLHLEEGQSIPWHHHGNVSDQFICMLGPMIIRLREPVESMRLEAGEFLAVQPNRPHQVQGENGAACKFAIVQGVGTYNFVAEQS